MDINNLSSNWKKLQATLKSPKSSESTATLLQQNALKRKREPQRGSTRSQSLAQVSTPRKKPRTQKSMAQNGTAGSGRGSIQEIENSDNVTRPRLTNGAAAGHVNAGLSPA